MQGLCRFGNLESLQISWSRVSDAPNETFFPEMTVVEATKGCPPLAAYRGGRGKRISSGTPRGLLRSGETSVSASVFR